MKFLLIAALIAVAAAVPHGGLVTPGAAGPAPAPIMIDDSEPIAVGPAIINEFEPIAIGPAIVKPEYEPISVGPAIIDFPVPVDTSPVVVGPIPEGASPLVQIIVNINQAGSPAFPEIEPSPVQVVDPAEEEIVEPVEVVEIAPEPVQVVEVAPAPVEPVIIGTPIIPSPVNIPEELN